MAPFAAESITINRLNLVQVALPKEFYWQLNYNIQWRIQIEIQVKAPKARFPILQDCSWGPGSALGALEAMGHWFSTCELKKKNPILYL